MKPGNGGPPARGPTAAPTTAQITDWVGGRLVGPGDLRIAEMQTIAESRPGHLTYVGRANLLPDWERCAASAALVREGLGAKPAAGKALIFVADVDLATATVLEKLAPPTPLPAPGIHATAVVDPQARIDPTARIGPLCVIGPRAVIGAHTVLQGQVAVLADSRIGAHCMLWPGVVIRERCEIGDACILHSNVSIGTDGFGYRPSADRRSLVKIPQIGTVRIGRDVEIGSNACVDRGKFGATVIGDGTKIDNLVQIAHNCVVGRCVVMAGMSGISGSVSIGDGAMLGGRTGVSDHVHIGRGAHIGISSLVLQDVPDGARVIGYPAIESGLWKRITVLLTRLPDLARRIAGRAPGAD
jgi:UDP-3-O-[3-hydroxymyristoyl] glucosamine N-acyltransferase